jgi:eukaryotic-like serine/threonine-protein kinase
LTPAALARGRYTLEQELGRGGMAVVMLARDTTLDRAVAVKLLSENAAADTELRERFLREGRFAASLGHANVVAVYDTGEQDGQPYIVMECVEGETLADVVRRRGPLPPDDVIDLGRQACAGLEHAHARGLVHRDVKPQNLLLREDGTLKVADFGIARSGSGSATITQAGTLLGTAAYMAPEVVQGEPATAASDVYSLGAVLYELVTGEPPRRATTIADLAHDEPVRRPSELSEDVPAQLEETILRCLERDPALRPASARELADRLGAPASATFSQRPTEILGTPERSARSRRPLAAALAGLAAAVLVLALVLSDDEPPRAPEVEPVPVGGTPAQDARNLAEWLRSNSG